VQEKTAGHPRFQIHVSGRPRNRYHIDGWLQT
jgi:hypothetical protein